MLIFWGVRILKSQYNNTKIKKKSMKQTSNKEYYLDSYNNSGKNWRKT